jgi:hypothetical protein
VETYNADWSCFRRGIVLAWCATRAALGQGIQAFFDMGGLVIPVNAILAGMICWQCGLVVALIYPLQIFRLVLKNKKELKPHPWILASFSVLGRFAEMYDQFGSITNDYTAGLHN